MDDNTLSAIAETRNDVKWIREEMVRGRKKLDDHDKRIGSLEGWRKWMVGLGVGIGALFGVGSGHLPKL